MPTVKITGNQVVYYEKTLELPQDEFDELMSLQDDGGLMAPEIMQWLADGDSGFTGEDAVEYEDVQDLDIEVVSR